ncbi:hypothetical protein M9H77_30401 [Catharanthus roseus]|uniref:Uncharacterized protein n=1 Tax=Catharanthus roseus TaxID=4058 RepID=A0ACB9ZXH3_CATRO|nr:hypothetical protein M9H77_30401 [Catharanthus roseus]
MSTLILIGLNPPQYYVPFQVDPPSESTKLSMSSKEAQDFHMYLQTERPLTWPSKHIQVIKIVEQQKPPSASHHMLMQMLQICQEWWLYPKEGKEKKPGGDGWIQGGDVDLEMFQEFIEIEEDCERGEGRKKKARLDDDDEDEEEEDSVKRRGPYGTKKYNCPTKLKSEKSAIGDKWKLYVKDGTHNHKIGVCPHAYVQVARLTDDQLKLTEEFSRCHVAPQNIMASLLEKNSDCVVSKQTIYNARAKMKKKRMEGRNTIEELLHQCNQQGYRCYSRNCEESNVLSDIIVVHPVSILMIRTWPFVLIMDTTNKTNESETTNQPENEHAPLNAWIETRHGDLDTVFLKIDSLIDGQIAEIKPTFEYSQLKEKENDKNNLVIAQLCYNVIHLALKIIKDEIKEPRRSSLIQRICAHTGLERHTSFLVHMSYSNDTRCPVSSAPPTIITEGRHKTDSTKRDKLHWEHIQITHAIIEKSRKSGLGLESGTSSSGRGRPPYVPGDRGIGRSRGRSSRLSSVSVKDVSVSHEFPYTGDLYKFVYPWIIDWKNVEGDGKCGFTVISYFLYGVQNRWSEVCDICGMRCTINGFCT